MDWFKTGKQVYKGCILSALLFNFYAEYIMQNAVLDDSQIGIKTKITDDTTLMTESEEKLKSLLWQWKRQWKS